MPNHLQNESSPYLRQHMHNPVDWYPWGKEALEKAVREDKPIFLSIGYSTCHWCHVMARESFENPEIAEILNADFVSVKVDREERPDLDAVYMKAVQAFTGSGGWPMSVFITPDQKPFFAGTYFPQAGRGGMVGLKELLNAIRESWQEDREELLTNADAVAKQLRDEKKADPTPTRDLPADAVTALKRRYDAENGGFGRPPKFPMPHQLLFLLSYFRLMDDASALQMAEGTLRGMYRGGLFDHVGFGFCRYATDARFLVPHFEKMLYDNAMLTYAYSEAFAVTGKELYLQIARKTADYVLREMTHPDGGFFSAQDADSEGEEGRYYLVTPEEIIALLGEKDARRFNRRFGITKEGNFEGKNIPNLLENDGGDPETEALLPRVRAWRAGRSKLHRDDKMLAFWNGLMIAGLCRLYLAGGGEGYRAAAVKAERFLRENLSENDALFVSFREGKRGAAGFLDDYAGYIFALLHLHAATLEEAYLARAVRLCRRVRRDFADREGGGFFMNADSGERLILRPKETHDGALPSGNSLMAWNLVRLAHLTGDTDLEGEAERQLSFLRGDAASYPPDYAMYLLSSLEFDNPPPKVHVALAPGDDEAAVLSPIPRDHLILLHRAPTAEYALRGGKTTYYLCRGHQCLPPVNEWQDR